MPKTTSDGLTRSATGCFIAVPIWNSGVKELFMTYSTHCRCTFSCWHQRTKLSRTWQQPYTARWWVSESPRPFCPSQV